MAWNPKKHLRDPMGRFRKMNLAPGWHEYKRGTEIKHYYINEMNQLADGSNILHMSAQGRVFGSYKDDKPLERIHLVGNDENEQMAVAASGETTFGVINHDKQAPKEAFSLNRGHEFQPVGDNLPDHETAFGGRPAQMSGRKDGKVYNTLNARKAEQANANAFDDPAAKIYQVDPAELAEGAAKARNYYHDKFGMNRSQAESQPVYVYADKDGKVHVDPVYFAAGSIPAVEAGVYGDKKYYTIGDDKFVKVGDDLVQMKKRRSPNTHGGGGSVKLRGRDLTRMSRSMQQDGIKDIDMTVAGGTNTNKDGKPLQNALHVRKFYRNPTSGDYATVWGTIETVNHGYEKQPARSAFSTMAEYKAYEGRTRKVRERAAAKYTNPHDRESAAKLMRAKYGSNRYFASDIEMATKKGDAAFSIRSADGHTRTLCDGSGTIIGREARDTQGFTDLFNQGKSPANRIEPSQVKRTDKGRYEVTHPNGTKSYFTPGGKPSPSSNT